MISALIVTAVLQCKPAPLPSPPLPTTLSCEGADQVRRAFDGREIDRWPNATPCSVVRCEGAALVRRDASGFELERWPIAPQCTVARCEGSDWVRRTRAGALVERRAFASACAISVKPQHELVRFGLTVGR